MCYEKDRIREALMGVIKEQAQIMVALADENQKCISYTAELEQKLEKTRNRIQELLASIKDKADQHKHQIFDLQNDFDAAKRRIAELKKETYQPWQ